MILLDSEIRWSYVTKPSNTLFHLLFHILGQCRSFQTHQTMSFNWWILTKPNIRDGGVTKISWETLNSKRNPCGIMMALVTAQLEPRLGIQLYHSTWKHSQNMKFVITWDRKRVFVMFITNISSHSNKIGCWLRGLRMNFYVVVLIMIMIVSCLHFENRQPFPCLPL